MFEFNIFTSIGFLLTGFIIGLLGYKYLAKDRIKNAKSKADELIETAKKEADSILKDASLKAKDRMAEMRNDFERETRERKNERERQERRLTQREENLEKKFSLVDSKELELGKREKNIKAEEAKASQTLEEYKRLLEEEKKRLERVAGLTTQDAKKELMNAMLSEAKYESAKKIKEIEDKTKEESEKKAKEIISIAIQRYAGEYTSGRTVSVVNLPNDEMKGRIIGREGRNIRAFEGATGIDLIIDDTPEAVILSGYNPIRREVAKVALDRLVADGRIHPSRIEEIVAKVEKEIEGEIKELGERATFDVGIHGIHPELIRLVGSLKYRYSYAQNQYEHSLEVAFIAGTIAGELGINIKQAKRAGLLHDIGKAVDHEVEGSHAVIGADLAKKFGEVPQICQAIKSHHEEIKPESVLDFVVQAADGISGARPGARREMLESYAKRIEDLEKIANSFKGVERSYAIQAGREVRIMVQSESVSDEESVILARDVAKKIESELTYPGQVKIMVIREKRVVEFAK